MKSGYELTAVPHNYVDKPPENILDVQKNLQLLQRILQSFYHNVETFKVLFFLFYFIY